MTEIVLQGIVGSTAYGLAGPDSDKDYLGIFRAPIDEVLGLGGSEAVKESPVGFNPDSTLHELGKYLSLALKCNPTAIELLWLDSYTVETPIGTALILQRQYFLSERYVRNAYGGYVKQQADRLLGRHKDGKDGFSSDVKKRTEKHGRHCFRLLFQGMNLLLTGEVQVDMSGSRDFLFEAGRHAAEDPEAFHFIVMSELAKLDAVESVLPREPDREKINSFLVKARKEQL